MHQVTPNMAKKHISDLNENLLDDAKKSHELTGDMTYEDFKSAADNLGLTSKTDVMEHLTDKTPDDLGFIKRNLLKTIVDMDKPLKLGGRVTGIGKWGGKEVPGMINGRHK